MKISAKSIGKLKAHIQAIFFKQGEPMQNSMIIEIPMITFDDAHKFLSVHGSEEEFSGDIEEMCKLLTIISGGPIFWVYSEGEFLALDLRAVNFEGWYL